MRALGRVPSITRHGLLSLLVGSIVALSGCQLAGVMAASAQREGSTTVPAETDELVGKTFAVVVAMDRSVAAISPTLDEAIAARMTDRLAANAMASGVAPADQVIAFLGNTPSWRAWPRGRLAEELGVDRVVLVDLIEYRLNEPGNAFLWDGLAWGSVEVYNADAFDPDRPTFESEVRVRFPDSTGVSPTEMQESLVATALVQRFIDRASWLFYEHEEPNIIKY